MSQLLDFDPLTRQWTTFDYDHVSGKTILGYFQDIEPIMEWNKSRANNVDKSKKQLKRDLLHYARVPNVTQLDMLNRHGVRFWDPNHKRKVMALLNSDEYAHCRISHLKHDR